MSLTVTFPGKHGDVLWACPTFKALAAQHGPVKLVIAPCVEGLAPLLRQQPYLESVTVDPTWQTFDTAPMTPRIPPNPPFTAGENILHLGYDGWPSPDLPRDIARRAGVEIDLERPWIEVDGHICSPENGGVAIGFTDEHFELKYGVTDLLLYREKFSVEVLCPPRSRWVSELDLPATTWVESARVIESGDVFFGCCSALHVLAVAMGKPCVIMEPAEHRHNSIFWPLGKTGRVQLVLGGDGQPTFDARHCRDVLDSVLSRKGTVV